MCPNEAQSTRVTTNAKRLSARGTHARQLAIELLIPALDAPRGSAKLLTIKRPCPRGASAVKIIAHRCQRIPFLGGWLAFEILLKQLCEGVIKMTPLGQSGWGRR